MIIVGDCREVMAGMEPESVDAIVTDPPYGLEFMGKKWDRLDNIGQTSHSGIPERDGSTVFGRTRVSYSGSSNRKCRACNRWEWAPVKTKCSCDRPDFPNVAAHQGQLQQTWHEAWAREAYRVLKPGGHLLAFGGSRTYHRMACAVEDAGFEIRDQIQWLYGSGFPKSLNVGKAIDKTRSEDRPHVEAVAAFLRDALKASGMKQGELEKRVGLGYNSMCNFTQPNRKSFGVPRWELWEAFRSELEFGDEMDAEVWRLNGRKGTPGEAWTSRPLTGAAGPMWESWEQSVGIESKPRSGERRDIPATDLARQWDGWGTALKPAHEPIVVARKPLIGTVAANVERYNTGALNIDGTRIGTNGKAGRWPANVCLDEEAGELLGPPARFFYTAKASRKERERGLDGLDERAASDRHAYSGLPDQRMNHEQARRSARNHHPTVKPVALMRWLVRLVTPPGGLVLDPFAGSGTTGIACVLEGFEFVGIEQDAEYAEIAEKRIAAVEPTLFAEVTE